MIKSKFSQGFSAFIVLLIAVIVLAGIGAFVMMRRPSTTSPSTTPGQSTETATSEGASAGETESTIPDIVGRGQSLECDWKMPTDGAENPFGTGKLYTAENRGRSTISGSSSGMTIDGNAIYKDNEVYSWITVAGTTMGFKFTKEELESMNSSMTQEQKQQAEQIRSRMTFNCRPWTVDESKFVLPSGVEFK